MATAAGDPLRVRVEVLSWVNKFVGGPGTGETTLVEEVKPGATVRAVLRQVTARYPELDRALWDPGSSREIGDNVEVMVNDAVLGVSHDLDSALARGDHITLLGQYMGGSVITKQTDRSTYLDVSKIAWEPSGFPGVEIKVLYREASGQQTTLTRLQPGARIPRHRHVGLEQSYVLEGSLVDEDGACAAGNFVWRRRGSVHEAWSPDGCVVLGIFEAPNQFLT